jgi:peptidoglycan/xylan/chitin deacetylase (PgdA/CDA1 family)
MTDVLVLCYHAISPSWDAELSVTPDEFEYQVDYLLGRGWHATTFADAVLNAPARRTLAITFDDAFASIGRYATPVLARLGAPATVFVPTAFPGAGEPLSWPGIEHWVATPHAAELAPMTWNELEELADRGWEIGSHTRTHPRLTQLDDARLASELADSRNECARALGRPCRTIAYPYGDVDVRVANAARAVGYVAGASLSSRLDALGPYRHPRVGIYHADNGPRFRLKASRPLRLLRASGAWPGSAA